MPESACDPVVDPARRILDEAAQELRLALAEQRKGHRLRQRARHDLSAQGGAVLPRLGRVSRRPEARRELLPEEDRVEGVIAGEKVRREDRVEERGSVGQRRALPEKLDPLLDSRDLRRGAGGPPELTVETAVEAIVGGQEPA